MRGYRLPGRAMTEPVCGTRFKNPSPDLNSPVAEYACTCDPGHPQPHVAHVGNLPAAIAWDAGTEPDDPAEPASAIRAPCGHCRRRPAEKRLFTTLIRTGGHDATKTTMHVCGACAAEAEKWLDEIGLHVATTRDQPEWDAIIYDLPEAAGATAR